MYDDSNASELLFKALSQSLEVNARTYRWTVENNKECKVCNVHVEKSEYHLTVECVGYERKRQIL